MSLLSTNLSEKYNGEHASHVLYANLPATDNMLTAKFHDCTVNVKDLKILNSFEGILEGDPIYISENLFEAAIIEAVQSKAIVTKVIYPQWRQDFPIPLPPYRYEITIKHYVPKDETDPYGDSDWYYLRLIWFDDAPSPDQSLTDYINSITSQLDFFSITPKLTEDEKEYWC
jgi:hypothetical protein